VLTILACKAGRQRDFCGAGSTSFHEINVLKRLADAGIPLADAFLVSGACRSLAAFRRFSPFTFRNIK
jgi:hypothetical protein